MRKCIPNIHYRPAKPSDVEGMTTFIFTHGTNPWNYLPEVGVRSHLQEITSKSTYGVIAEIDGVIVGFVTCKMGNFFPRYESEGASVHELGYIAEAVVHKDHVGRGIGTQLLEEAKQLLREQGARVIYIDCHEENSTSTGMMRKAGFIEVETFFDPERRFVGSRRTTVLKFEF